MYCVDSGVWIGAFNPKDAHHERAKPIIKAVTDGEPGGIIITDHIFGEVATYTRRKIGIEKSVKAARAMLDTDHVEIIVINDDLFSASYHIFERYPQLSFADAASIVVMRNQDVTEIFSFDSGFDGVREVNRLNALPKP
ncbi:hypothetical protein AKJ44_01640 [candidate division MSBL1 archaeon SCGC-AAA261F17]|uniref:PIN domain-containing protein n=1 Tax=candidate division MSBL1 archaeon SCGC-AAA261F17 TaxID=1698274 RepID=A0A133V6D5_9EURY|nr:hypothetical protein AKJ44_01640 [candidate division MSBL1 archaeon SCGC-AAA261F17]